MEDPILNGRRPRRQKGVALNSEEHLSSPEPLRVIEVIESQGGQPRNDGTPGSGLYKVPLRLNRETTDLEARLIERTWDSPPRWTTMHRPGICSVYATPSR
jgi:hypothetical protein